MAESYVQVATDGSGKRVRTRSRLVNAVTVEEQYIAMAADPTYYVWVVATACATNKYFWASRNNSATNVIKLRKLFLCNATTTAVTGTPIQFDITRSTTIVGGALTSPNPMDTNDGTLTAANFTSVSGPSSVTQGVTLYSWYTNNDEIGVTNAFPTATIQAGISLSPEGNEIKELVLRNGEGVCVKQITNSAVGQYALLAVITVE